MESDEIHDLRDVDVLLSAVFPYDGGCVLLDRGP